MGRGLRALLSAVLVCGMAAGTAVDAEASFPGRNGGIVVSSSVGSWDGDYSEHHQGLKMLGGDGGRLPGCTTVDDGSEPPQGFCAVSRFSMPSVSSDGRWVVFDGGESIGIADLQTGDARVLPRHTVDDSNPAFSPDGRSIVFDGVGADGSRDVYVADRGLLFPRRLAAGANPTWSSRGRIAFFRAGGVHVADPSGRRAPRRLTRGSEPDWSPHGSKLAVVRERDVYVVDLRRGGAAMRITTSGQASTPAWSPDGRLIAFTREFLGVSVIGARGGHPRIVDRNDQGDSGIHSAWDPSWQPLRRGVNSRSTPR